MVTRRGGELTDIGALMKTMTLSSSDVSRSLAAPTTRPG
jgi:hypothetical protein